MQEQIDANKYIDFLVSSPVMPGRTLSPVKQPNINKTHTDFLQKPSRRETSNWVSAAKCEREKDQASKSSTPQAPSGLERIYLTQSSPGLPGRFRPRLPVTGGTPTSY